MATGYRTAKTDLYANTEITEARHEAPGEKTIHRRDAEGAPLPPGLANSGIAWFGENLLRPSFQGAFGTRRDGGRLRSSH